MKNEKLTLPIENSDIIDRVNKRYMSSIIVTVVWCIAVIIIITLFNVGADSLTNTGVLIATIVIPILALQPYRILSDQAWTGTVRKVVRKDKPYKSTAPLHIDSSSIVPVITLYIERSDGILAVKHYKLKRDEYQYAEALVEYYKPDTVVHCYKGLEYPKKDENIIQYNKFDYRLCIVCGNFGDWHDKQCKHCKSSFVE